MCGIAGFLNTDGATAEAERLWQMIFVLGHRGPDDSGIHTDHAVGLAHARLSIIDLGGGHQPMHNGDRSIWITFNGEIFNYVELKKELSSKGLRFSTRSDTEVILKLYEEYGPACVQHLNGQWAFAIWDSKKKRLFLSRDRFGVRPLYYAMSGDSLVFASEIKSLLVDPGIDAEIDLQALSQIFTYWFPLAPRTIFRNIFELPPSHSLIAEKGEINVQRYWGLDYSQVDPAAEVSQADEDRYSEELRELLVDATRIRLRADVPVGAYVSGGLDSSIISTLAKKFVGSSLCTFSVAFEDRDLDESAYQREIVRTLGTNHKTIRCTAAEIGEALPEVIWHTECPVLRTAPVPLFLLSKLVRDSGLKVVLTGDGSDEFQGGYDIYKEAKIRAFLGAQVDSKRRPLLLKRLYPYLAGLHKQSVAYLQTVFGVRQGGASEPFFSHIPRWESAAKAQLFFSAAVRAELRDCIPYADMQSLLPESFSGWNFFSRAQYLEGAFLLPGYLLSSQGDRVSMAHSVEGRHPFLDHRVVEFSTTVPPRLQMKVLKEKYLLKRAFRDVVSSSITQRPKQPYQAPGAISFFDPITGRPRHPYIEETLSADRIREYGIFDTRTVLKLIEKVNAGRAISHFDNSALVGIVSTQLIVEQFIVHLKEKLSDGATRARSAPVCN
jgi:asparagine synthase (glutamine-hydrolysing)